MYYENNKSNLCILTSRLFFLVYVSYHCCFYLFIVQQSSTGCCCTRLCDSFDTTFIIFTGCYI